MLPITQLEFLPKISGIYKVLDVNGNVIYVGQAKNIHSRWKKGHHKLSEIIAECGVEANIDWAEIPEWLLNRAENAAISFYQPKLNSKTPPVV
jgi:excinuclease UvrABC nuclease subunit